MALVHVLELPSDQDKGEEHEAEGNNFDDALVNYVIEVEVSVECCDHEDCNYQADYQLLLIS